MAAEIKKDKTILAELFSGNPSRVNHAVERIKSSGNASYLSDVFSIYWPGIDPNVKLTLSKLICDLKNNSAASYIVDFLSNIEDEDDLSYFTGACWQSAIDFSEYFPFFISLVIEKNYMISLEAFSVIENSCLNLSEEEKVSGISRLKGSLSSMNEDKKSLLVELIHVIENQ